MTSTKKHQEREHYSPTVIVVQGFLSEKSEKEFEKIKKQILDTSYKDYELKEIKWESKNISTIIINFCINNLCMVFFFIIYFIVKLPINFIYSKIQFFIKKEGSKSFIVSFFNKIDKKITIIFIKKLLKHTHKYWVEAVRNSEIMGEKLASYIQTNSEKKFIIIGHSLGGRGILYALLMLKNSGCNNIENIYLLGAAEYNNKKFNGIENLINGKIYNVYSSVDAILSAIFVLGQISVDDAQKFIFGEIKDYKSILPDYKVIGVNGIDYKSDKIFNMSYNFNIKPTNILKDIFRISLKVHFKYFSDLSKILEDCHK